MRVPRRQLTYEVVMVNNTQKNYLAATLSLRF